VNDYRNNTIKKIRRLSHEFDDWTDKQIGDFYSNWSEQKTFNSIWIANGEEAFVQYATRRPMDTWQHTT
jgi:hypothetical protein